MRFRLYRKTLAFTVMAIHVLGTPAGVGAIERCCDSLLGHDSHQEHQHQHEHTGHDHHHDAKVETPSDHDGELGISVTDKDQGEICGMDHIGIPGVNLKPIQPDVLVQTISLIDFEEDRFSHEVFIAAPDRAPPNLGQQIYLIQETILQ